MAETAYVFECVGGCGAKTNGSQFCRKLYCPKMHMEEEEKDMNENTNLSCVDVPLKRKCEEEGEMPNSKRVRVDDDSSNAWLYHRLYQLIRLKNHGRGRGSDTQEEG